MRPSFGHFGDAVEALREMYESTSESKTRQSIIEFTRNLTDLSGDEYNLAGFWPEFSKIEGGKS